MANPALWGFGLAAVGLIAAGVWLKLEEGRPAVPVTLTAPADPAPRPGAGVEARPPADPVANPPPGAPVQRVGPSEPGVMTRVGTGEAPVVTAKPPLPDPAPATDRGALPPPDPVPPDPAPQDPAPPDPPPPDPGPQDRAQAPLPPGVFAAEGTGVWAVIPGSTLSEAEITAAIGAAPAEAAAFGAIALSRMPGARPAIVTGFADLDTAAQTALVRCQADTAFCQLVAELAPPGHDGRRSGTLSARQGRAWAEFMAPLPPDSRSQPWHLALAVAPGGAAGVARGTPADHRREAMRACRAELERLAPAGAEEGDCAILATRTVAPGEGSEDPPVLRLPGYDLPRAEAPFDPVIHTGTPVAVWAPGADRGRTGRGVQVMAYMRSSFDGRAWYGAGAVAPGAGYSEGYAVGYATLAAAEAEALARCRGWAPEGCRVQVHLVPQDHEGLQTGTLTPAQGRTWRRFQALPDTGNAAFAISDDGAAGLGRGDSPEAAEAAALAACAEVIAARLRPRPSHTGADTCRTVARVQP